MFHSWIQNFLILDNIVNLYYRLEGGRKEVGIDGASATDSGERGDNGYGWYSEETIKFITYKVIATKTKVISENASNSTQSKICTQQPKIYVRSNTTTCNNYNPKTDTSKTDIQKKNPNPYGNHLT